LLPLPNHSIASPPKLPPPVYEGHHYDSPLPRNEYHQMWNREGGTSLPTLSQHIAAPYYPGRSELGNRPHGSHEFPPPNAHGSVLPIPTSALVPRSRISEMPRRSSISHEHSMRYATGPNHHQTDNMAANMHYGYNPAQESRQASLAERPNGNLFEEQQFWPPPPNQETVVGAQAPQLAGSKGFQGFNNR